jgi:ferredoxin-NADP reductase
MKKVLIGFAAIIALATGQTVMAQPPYAIATITQVHHETNSVTSVTASLDNSKGNLKPGDAVIIQRHHRWLVPFKKMILSLSKVSQNEIQFTFKKSKNGLSPFLTTAQPGTPLEIHRVDSKYSHGLRPDDLTQSKPLVFISSGLGITPHMATLRDLIQTQEILKRKVVFILIFREPGDLIYKNELESIQSQYPQNFKLKIHYSKQMKRRVRSNDIQQTLAENEIDVNHLGLYICGSYQFAQDIKKMLNHELSVPIESVQIAGNG